MTATIVDPAVGILDQLDFDPQQPCHIHVSGKPYPDGSATLRPCDRPAAWYLIYTHCQPAVLPTCDHCRTMINNPLVTVTCRRCDQPLDCPTRWEPIR